MAQNSDKDAKDAKGAAGVAFSRPDTSTRSSTPIQEHEVVWCSPTDAAPTRTDEKRRTIEERERKMVELAKAHILSCGDFLLVQDLANHLGIHAGILSTALKEWEANHRIFSIEHDGFRLFPAYGFPPHGGDSPIPGLMDVLSILCPMKDGWGLSFWFISPNGFLGGERPQDLLSIDVKNVILAAHDEAVGVTHG